MNHMIADPMAAYFGAVTPMPWNEFKASVLELYKPPMRSKATYSGIVHCFNLLDALGGIETTADLTVPLIARFVQSRPPTLSPNSVRGNLRYVQSLCSYAEKMNFLRPSPFRIRGISDWCRPAPPAKKQYAAKADIGKVLDHAAGRCNGGGWREWKARREHAFLATLAFTGCRYSEAVYMQAADVDFAAETIAIVSRREHRLKTAGAHAVLPLLPELAVILRSSWMEHRMSVPSQFMIDDPDCPWLFPTVRRHKRAPWNSGGVGQRPSVRVKALAAEVGVRLTPLMLRHSFATWLAADGAGPHIVRQWLRHTVLTTQQHYVHQDHDAMRSAAAKLSY
jgi:integrase